MTTHPTEAIRAEEPERRMSKVAFCPICNGFTIACHIDYLDHQTESDFKQALNDGFCLKIETASETRARQWIKYSECLKNHLSQETNSRGNEKI